MIFSEVCLHEEMKVKEVTAVQSTSGKNLICHLVTDAVL